MAETVKGVMREVHVKTKDDFGNADWDSVYKIGTETTYIKMPGSGKSLSDILGYDTLEEDALASIFDGNKTIKTLIEKKDSILDFDANYTSLKTPITNSKSLYVEKEGKDDGKAGERFGALMPYVNGPAQAFYSGDFSYYALGGIYGPGAWISIRNFDEHADDNLQHEEDFRLYKDNEDYPEDLRSDNCIEKLFHDTLSKNGFTIKCTEDIINDNEEITSVIHSLRIYRGCRIENYMDEKKKNYGLSYSIKVMDTAPAAGSSSWVMMPIMFVVPPHTMVYTRSTARTDAKYAINFFPCANLQKIAETKLADNIANRGEAFKVVENSYHPRINGEIMSDPTIYRQ